MEADACEIALLLACCDYATSGLLILDHEADQTEDDGLHVPQRVPRLRMIVAHAHADALVYLKSAVGCNHLNTRWLQWVLFRHDDSSEVVTIFIGAIFEAKNDIIPNIEVIGIRRRNKVIEGAALNQPLS